MHRWAMALTAFAGLAGALGVAGGAAAAHIAGGGGLETAATYALIHSAAIAALALGGGQNRGVLTAASLLALGILLFSGDLALRALAGAKLFAMAAPAGGLILMAGWLTLAVAATVEIIGRTAASGERRAG